jgi:acyl-CoA thioesterase FadM
MVGIVRLGKRATQPGRTRSGRATAVASLGSVHLRPAVAGRAPRERSSNCKARSILTYCPRRRSQYAMNLIIRLLIVLATAMFRGPLGLGDTSRVRLRVLPNDLDLNLHMNNGRYLTVMDLGRIDFLIRAGSPRLFLRNRWQPLIGGTIIRYRFGLRAFERFEVATRILCWDEKWFYFEQRVENSQGIAAIALSKALVRDRDGTVSPDSVLRSVGIAAERPDPALSVSRWLAAEDMLHVGERIPDPGDAEPDRGSSASL